MVYQQDSSYGFLNIDVIDYGNIIRSKNYSNNDNVLDEFNITILNIRRNRLCRNYLNLTILQLIIK